MSSKNGIVDHCIFVGLEVDMIPVLIGRVGVSVHGTLQIRTLGVVANLAVDVIGQGLSLSRA